MPHATDSETTKQTSSFSNKAAENVKLHKFMRYVRILRYQVINEKISTPKLDIQSEKMNKLQ